jgi:flagellin
MTSINTNNSAMVALSTLRSVNNNLQTTQSAVSSGLRISKASDNATYWSIATTMKSDVSAIGAVNDALGLGAAKVDTAYTAMDAPSTSSARSRTSSSLPRKAASTRARSRKNLASCRTSFRALPSRLRSTVKTGSLQPPASPLRWFRPSFATPAVAFRSRAPATRSTDGATGNVLFGMSGGSIDTTTGILGTAESVGGSSYSVFSLNVTNMTSGDIDSAMSMVESALTAMTSAASKLGSLSSRIDAQTTFASSLSDARPRALASSSMPTWKKNPASCLPCRPSSSWPFSRFRSPIRPRRRSCRSSVNSCLAGKFTPGNASKQTVNRAPLKARFFLYNFLLGYFAFLNHVGVF